MSKYSIDDNDQPLSAQDSHEEVILDRGDVLAEAAEPKKKNKMLIAMLVFLIGIIAIAGFVFLFIKAMSSDNSDVVVDPDPTLERRVSAPPDISSYQEQLREAARRQEEARLRAEREEEERRRREAEAQALADRIAPPANNRNAPPLPPNHQAVEVDERELRRLSGDVLLAGFGGSGTGTSTSGGFFDDESRVAGGGFNDMLQGGVYAAGTVRRLENLNLLLRRGTTIPCVLQNRIVSTYPSLSSCVITQDVYSADGSTVLIERGSLAYGEQNLALKQGQARLFMVWNEIDTTSGKRVRIDSLATDNLGASGIDAYVDKHFWDRFGGAILLSLIDDGLAIMAQRIEDDRYEFRRSRDAGRNMAEIALEDSINIPPTGYVNHGTLLNIRVSRDVDFTPVYRVSRTQ